MTFFFQAVELDNLKKSALQAEGAVQPNSDVSLLIYDTFCKMSVCVIMAVI